MSRLDLSSLGVADTITISLSLAAIAVVYHLVRLLYNAFYGPLSKFPGPTIRALTNVPAIHTMVSGHDNDHIPALHEKYGPIVRVGPNELSFAGGSQAWHDIYGFKKAGQPKPFKDRVFYGTPYNGVDSIITADDANHTRQRKILSHAFADKSLKLQEPLLKRWADKMQVKLAEAATRGESVDLLKFYNCKSSIPLHHNSVSA